MTMAPRFRKFVLTAHATSPVGWLGAVVAFLPLAVVSLTSQDAQMVRAAMLGMEVTAPVNTNGVPKTEEMFL